jgi:hypothetical protein
MILSLGVYIIYMIYLFNTFLMSFLCVTVLDMELRTLSLLGKCSAT